MRLLTSAAVAAAMGAEKLIFLTDTPGILQDKNDPKSLLSELTLEDCRRLIDTGVVEKGMIPKVEACMTALQAGVTKAHIIDGRMPHSLLLEIYTEAGVGTEIVL